MLRISDSLAFGAASRHVYGVIDDAEHGRKLFVKGNNNLAQRAQKALAFGFATKEVGVDRRTGKPIVAPHIVWHSEPVEITATEAMQAVMDSKSPSARDDAKRFVESLFEDGSTESIDSTEALESAKANGITLRTLRRAVGDLGVRAKKDGPVVDGERTWRWYPPK
jgi:hypothetical protein